MKKQSDAIIHTPGGSLVPGKLDPNPYIFFQPNDLRKLLETEKNEDELEKIDSALKQWERIYQWPGYLWRKMADDIRVVAYKIKKAEIVGPAQNIPYYQECELPEGSEAVIDSLRGLYDQYNEKRFDIPRQGERPDRDIDTSVGDFSAPHDPIVDSVRPRGDGPDPDGMEVDPPPTGGDLDGLQDLMG